MAVLTDFGRETSCTTSLRPGQYVSGARLVGEAAYRRLTTPRGMLQGGEAEADYGIDLLDMIGSVETTSDVAALGGRVRNELLKDERILTVDVTPVATTATNGAVSVDLTVEATTKEGPFTLAVRVSEVTVQLLGIEAAT